MFRKKHLIGLIISLVLLVVLCNPQWLPISDKTEWAMDELRQAHFMLEGNTHITWAHLLTLLMMTCLLWLCYNMIIWLLHVAGRRNGRAATVTGMMCGLVRYAVFLIGIIWGLSILGVNTASVLAGVGIVGLILGFGAQSLIEDIITGFFIIFEGQYGVGDIIVLDDCRGIVRNIGVRTTVIEDNGGNLKIVNNSDIRNLQNRSRLDSVAVCDISVSYKTDLKKLDEILDPALAKMFLDNQGLYLEEPKYYGVEALAESGMVLRFVAITKEEDVFKARRKLAYDLKNLFDEKNIEIPFPQIVVHRGGGDRP